jgi:uncharacterized membrane protein
MTYHWSLYLCIFLALWAMLTGGVFKAFSEFVMRGLAQAGPGSGIAAMKGINRTVLRTEFVFAILALGAISPGFALYAYFALDGTAAVLIVAAAAIYLPSTFFMMLLGNVPMNNRLDRVDPASVEGAEYWAHYVRRWTALNHFRTLGCIVTGALYALAALELGASTGRVA